MCTHLIVHNSISIVSMPSVFASLAGSRSECCHLLNFQWPPRTPADRRRKGTSFWCLGNAFPENQDKVTSCVLTEERYVMELPEGVEDLLCFSLGKETAVLKSLLRGLITQNNLHSFHTIQVLQVGELFHQFFCAGVWNQYSIQRELVPVMPSVYDSIFPLGMWTRLIIKMNLTPKTYILFVTTRHFLWKEKHLSERLNSRRHGCWIVCTISSSDFQSSIPDARSDSWSHAATCLSVCRRWMTPPPKKNNIINK